MYLVFLLQAYTSMIIAKHLLHHIYVPPKLGIKMFDAHILPILEYNSDMVPS